MYKLITGKILSALLLLSLISCARSVETGHKGQIVLSSLFDFATSSVSGYNFELEAFTRFPSIGDALPDIIVEKYTQINGEILPGFNSPSNNSGFALLAQSVSLTESYEFFENYLEFDPATQLSPSTDTIRMFQVWVLKTSQDNYVKLNVRDIQVLKNASGDFIEVKVDYYYQDDGTPLFPK